MIDIQNFFDQPVKNVLRTDDNIPKIATGQWDSYTTGRLLDYLYFKEYCKIIAIDLRKQKALDTDTKVVPQINLTGNYFEKYSIERKPIQR